ncbi:PIH1 domain-containing protein 1-like [Chelonus insularis]|uniref:PIH1 domain-containing protein 1-like n=1 Tax=Chelonus insularis TaxID=460826 RepID=UPI00158899D5|nr:PIH1 domain-containing protein 1-like [Chelonus insularis]XP_034950901.1 PIH1 domain-containing protein 1-like [Chelonus insularis]
MPNNLLDVDDNILKNSLRLPGISKEDEELDNILKSLEHSNVPSVTFRPVPGICIKIKTDTGEKIFINLCHTNMGIPPPEDISDERFFALLNESNPSWVIPMSIGNERYEKSNDGTSCSTYDVAINSDFFKKIMNQKHFLTFVILTIISAIESKFDKNLDSNNYVILKNKKVTGTLQDHRVEKREVRKPVMPKPLIEELPSTKKPIVPEKPSSERNSSETVNESEYIILRKPKEGDPEKLIGYFKLTNQTLKDDVEAHVGSDRIVVAVSKFHYAVDVFVPFKIQQDQVTASLDENLKVLRLDMPVIL